MDEGGIATNEDALRQYLLRLGSVLVAYSGGVDSTYLAAVAREVLGERALAATLDTPFLGAEERERLHATARQLGLRHVVVPADPLADDAVRSNRADRCYRCKCLVFEQLVLLAEREHLAAVVDGSHADDRAGYRPGKRALRELGVLSPLAELGFTKAAIRAASRRRGLPTADLPSNACLATRVPHGTALTRELLERVDRAERAVRALGFAQLRVRAHGDTARVELPAADLPRAAGESRAAIVAGVRAAGFRFVALDLDGYRPGSLDPVTA